MLGGGGGGGLSLNIFLGFFLGGVEKFSGVGVEKFSGVGVEKFQGEGVNIISGWIKFFR